MENALPDVPHIEVTGTADITVEPDFARIKAELKHVADDVSEAKRKVDSQSSAVIELAHRCNVVDADITATKLEIEPEYDWRSEGNEYKGTSVSRDVQIVLRDLEEFPKFLQGLADVPVYKLRHVTMDTTRRDEIEQQALAQAIRDAEKTAQAIAKGLNQRISGVIRAVHTDGRFNDDIFFRSISSSTEASFEVGTIEVSARIQILFAITPQESS